ncbi:alginate lyase family protein [Parabacteroides sp. Marseille-P3160]|uniref:alginate lyase family protein n=1 Tax=Parabacteroides sp. Marseille-P3160 TaxID=1917887 RepID=UPI0009BBB819|nr:alginate lyase family protein [Parabacteroides sp. Marseille-P3160]
MRIIILSILLFVGGYCGAQNDWRSIRTVEDVCKAYPGQVQSLFNALNLDYPGLTAVKAAYQKGDLPAACQHLLEYYGKSRLITPKEKLPAASSKEKENAEEILQDTYTFQGVKGKTPRLPDGHLQWAYNGPEDDIEWAWALNRHYPVNDLIGAYRETGNLDYIRYIDNFVKDWIISSWPYPAKKSNTAMWRGLEVSSREKVWKSVFYELWNTEEINPATQLLILTSLPSHAHYAKNFHAGGNWLTMEMSGLATVVSAWPELKEAPQWMDYSINAMLSSMKEQVYPDGVQTELTSHYHAVALSNFNLFANICKASGIRLPEYYTRTIKDMWNYLAWTIRPDGFGLLNNDADLDYNKDKILKIAEEYDCPEWTYIASNGNLGNQPSVGPSCFFPYAGQLISRNGYDAKAHWSFFDMGPWGAGHQHNDKLHLSVYAYGRDLLVDAGRFAYRGDVADKFRGYALGSQGHNLVLVDGKGQDKGIPVASSPVDENHYRIEKEYDYGSGLFDKFIDTDGIFSHTRSVMYVRDHFWIVADRLQTDRPREIETLWHWHPSCKIKLLGNGIVSTDNDTGNLTIIPVGNPGWKLKQITGQENPIQGWYSKEYNTYEPNMTSVFGTQLPADSVFVWILLPSEKKAPEIKASILSTQDNRVTIRIDEPGVGEWIIGVPFLDKKKIEYSFVKKQL